MGVQRDLIYDVGAHTGEDTDFYLRKGFRVVAFEADPVLVQGLEKRFADALREGRLTVVAGAISAGGKDTVTFYRFAEEPGLSTVDPDRAGWYELRPEEITVPAIDFGACLALYGTPYYLKVDIEGADRLCIQALRGSAPKPSYLSMESEKKDFGTLEEEIRLLADLGYDAFQAVLQASLSAVVPPRPGREGRYVDYTFRWGSSGLFGKELPGPWRDQEEILKQYRRIFFWRYRLFGDDTFWHRTGVTEGIVTLVSKLARTPLPGWFDTHARHASATQSSS